MFFKWCFEGLIVPLNFVFKEMCILDVRSHLWHSNRWSMVTCSSRQPDADCSFCWQSWQTHFVLTKNNMWQNFHLVEWKKYLKIWVSNFCPIWHSYIGLKNHALSCHELSSPTSCCHPWCWTIVIGDCRLFTSNFLVVTYFNRREIVQDSYVKESLLWKVNNIDWSWLSNCYCGLTGLSLRFLVARLIQQVGAESNS